MFRQAYPILALACPSDVKHSRKIVENGAGFTNRVQGVGYRPG
jgi:hypothetical protein